MEYFRKIFFQTPQNVNFFLFSAVSLRIPLATEKRISYNIGVYAPKRPSLYHPDNERN